MHIEKVFCDLDSLCYQASYLEEWEQCKICMLGKLKGIRETAGVPVEQVEGFIEHPDLKYIYRHHVAITRPYKGNRKDKEKPRWLREAKMWLAERRGISLVRAFESEDVCAIKATEYGLDRCAIAAIDKDLWQVPATFINYNKYADEEKKQMVMFRVTETQAHYNLYHQILTGDSTDNIPGLDGIGPKKAAAMLEGLEGKDLPLAVAKAYAERGFSYAYLVEQARLIYILRKADEPFMFPVTAEKFEDIQEESQNEK